MTPERAQRILHAFADWDESIQAARGRLGYLPEWRPDEPHDSELLGAISMDATPAGPFADWCGRHLEEMDQESYAAVRRLLLPDAFAPYWQACFLSAYSSEHLHLVRWDDGTRALPPADAFLTVTLDRTMGRPPRISIEGPLALATPATIREAADRAIVALQAHWRELAQPHPVVDARKRQPGPGRPAKLGPDPAAKLEQARARWRLATGASGEPTEDALAHYARVSRDTITRWRRAAKMQQKRSP